MKKELSISIVGTGNASHHFAHALFKANIPIDNIYGRNDINGIEIANNVGAKYANINKAVDCLSSVIVLAVSDNAIKHVADIVNHKACIVHCSGATDISAIHSNSRGVFYPLQTMSKNKEVDFREVPILLESALEEDKPILQTLANTISNKVYWVNSEQRLQIHLAAVFACNFSNFMMSLAQGYLEKHQLPFDLLRTLIKETAEKALTLSPKLSQTGPAVRGDFNVISKHEELLQNDDELLHVYQTITNLIKAENGIL